MGLNLFNKIINLEFLDNDGNVAAAIKCPKKGRKPSIEITGHLTGDSTLDTINITVKNMNLEIMGSDFPKVRVTAGYDDSTTTFDCDIFLTYQDSPGPESITTIQCTVGSLETCLKKTVSGLVQKDGSLQDAVKIVTDALGFDAPAIDPTAAKMKTETQLCLDGMAREALYKMKAAFPLAAFTLADNKIRVIALDVPQKAAIESIRYMSAPTQFTGGKNNPVQAVVTAPWIPVLRCHMPVEIPAKFYKGKGSVSQITDTTIITPYSIQIHFATTGSANKMVVSGTVNN